MGMSAPAQSLGAFLLSCNDALMPGKNQKTRIKAKTPIISFSQVSIAFVLVVQYLLRSFVRRGKNSI